MAHPTPKRRGDGWSAVVDVGVDPATGKRRQVRVTEPTKAACQARVAELLTRAGRGEGVAPAKLTVGEFLDRWLSTLPGTALAEATRISYQLAVRDHLRPAFGHLRLGKLSGLDVQDWLAAQQRAGYAPMTIRRHHAVLQRALNQAVRWGLLPRSPATGVDLPRAASAPVAIWTPPQARAFLAATAADPCGPAFLLALATALRIGELAALRWEDVDLPRARLRVRRTEGLRRGGVAVEERTKGKRERTVPLIPAAVAALGQERRRQQAAGVVVPWVFADRRGTRLTAYRLRYAFKQATKRAGLPPIRFHALRHTTATYLVQEGVPLNVVAAILGHADPTLVLTLYGHLVPAAQEAAVTTMEEWLGAREG